MHGRENLKQTCDKRCQNQIGISAVFPFNTYKQRQRGKAIICSINKEFILASVSIASAFQKVPQSHNPLA